MTAMSRTVFELPEIRQQKALTKKAKEAAAREDFQIFVESISGDFSEATHVFADHFVARSTRPEEVAAMRSLHGEEGVVQALRLAAPGKHEFAMRPENLEQLGFKASEYDYV